MPPPEAALHERFERLLTPEVRGALATHCAKLARDRADADDLLASTLLRAYRSFDTYDGERSFRNWLYRIASHHWTDTIRLRRRRVSTVANDETVMYLYVTAESPDPTPLALLDDAERSEGLLAMIAELPERSRETFLLRFVEELGYQEIAERTGTRVGTVRSRLHRGCVILRKRLECAKSST